MKIFKSYEEMAYASRFLDLDAGILKKRRYTKREIGFKIGFRSDNKEMYGFCKMLEDVGGLMPDGSIDPRVQLYTINTEKAFDFFMKDEVFQKLGDLFWGRFVSGRKF